MVSLVNLCLLHETNIQNRVHVLKSRRIGSNIFALLHTTPIQRYASQKVLRVTFLKFSCLKWRKLWNVQGMISAYVESRIPINTNWYTHCHVMILFIWQDSVRLLNITRYMSVRDRAVKGTRLESEGPLVPLAGSPRWFKSRRRHIFSSWIFRLLHVPRSSAKPMQMKSRMTCNHIIGAQR